MNESSDLSDSASHADVNVNDDPTVQVLTNYIAYLQRNIHDLAECAGLSKEEKAVFREAVNDLQDNTMPKQFLPEYKRHIMQMQSSDALRRMILNQKEALNTAPGRVCTWIQ